MRRYLYAGIVAAATLLAVLPGPASAKASHVLTTGKVGGSAVKKGATLQASLAKGTVAKFKNSLGTATCKKSTFTAKVTNNPTAPGSATESITAQKFSKCTITITGATVKKLAVGNLPWKGTVSDSKGSPVTVKGSSKAKPLLVTVTVAVSGVGSVTCGYTGKSFKGTASNKGNTVAFKNQKTTVAKGSSTLCPASATMSVTYGPVRDTSAKGSPAVFLN